MQLIIRTYKAWGMINKHCLKVLESFGKVYFEFIKFNQKIVQIFLILLRIKLDYSLKID